MTSRRVRVALLRRGRISRDHLDAIERTDGLALSAVCAVVTARARETGERHGAPWSDACDDMLARAAFDLVAICTLSGLHPEHGDAAARVGKPVVSEKPMAIALGGADRLVRACDHDDELTEAAAASPPTVYGLGHDGHYRNVLAVLRGDARPGTDGREGRKSQEPIAGVYESARAGCEVALPLPATRGRRRPSR